MSDLLVSDLLVSDLLVSDLLVSDLLFVPGRDSGIDESTKKERWKTFIHLD